MAFIKSVKKFVMTLKTENELEPIKPAHKLQLVNIIQMLENQLKVVAHLTDQTKLLPVQILH